MKPGQWSRVKELFQAALEREPAVRTAFLEEACEGDELVRREVESLLASLDIADSALADWAELSEIEPLEVLGGTLADQRVGPYQIQHRIGHGGMAAVYMGTRADDQYSKRVAIKVVTPGLDAEDVVRRFRNERQTLAALDHPNIVKLLDGGTTDGGLPYLVMDYVEGVPIDEYCDSHRLSITERLYLFRTVCAAVTYAHQRLIIHRDLKPSNILVTPDGVPKLLDFGISKLLNPEISAQTMVVTAAGLRLMTPEYASPEQVKGEPLTNATDIYSLGVMLYELLTGHRPYHLRQYTVGQIERVICETEPLKPSTAVTRVEPETSVNGKRRAALTPELVSRTREGGSEKLRRRLRGDLDTMVLKALRKEPQRRYASVYDFSEDIRRHLEGLPVAARRSTIAYRASKFVRRHKESGVVAIILLTLTVALGLPLLRRVTRENRLAPRLLSSASPAGRRSVAVLGFRNLSGRPEADWLSTALSEMLTTELGAGEKVRTIAGENVARMKTDLSLPNEESYGRETLGQIRRILDSDYVVLGSYFDLGQQSGGKVRLDVRVQDARQGETIASVSEEGTEAKLDELASRSGAVLRRTLGLAEVSEAEASEVRASAASSTEAERLYSEALAKLRLFDNLGARDLLQKAAAVQPSFALAHSALAEAWNNLGYKTKGAEEARKAFDLSSNLPREQRLWIEARYREATHDWDRAIEIYRSLFSFFPDNIEYGLHLASAQTSAGKGKEALNTAAALRALPAPANEDARIALAEAEAAYSVGDYKHDASAAANAAEKAKSLGARLVMADARYEQSWAELNLGELPKARADAEEAQRIYAAAGDRHGIAKAVSAVATVLLTEGDLAGAQARYETALKTARETGNQYGESVALNQLAIILNKKGELEKAKELYEQVRAIDHAIGDKNNEARALNNIADVLNDQGELAKSIKMHKQALAIVEETGNRASAALYQVNIATTLVKVGDLSNAKRMYEQVLQSTKGMGDRHTANGALSGLGDIQKLQGDLAGARKSYLQVMQDRQQMGERASAAWTRADLAEVALDEGNASEAEEEARAAIAEFHSLNLANNAAVVEGLLAEALLQQGRIADARQVMNEANSLAEKNNNRELRFSLAAVNAKLKAAEGRASEAIKGLQATIIEAAKRGDVVSGFEARLALAEIEMKAKRTASGRAHFQALKKDAEAKGMGLYVLRSAAADNKG